MQSQDYNELIASAPLCDFCKMISFNNCFKLIMGKPSPEAPTLKDLKLMVAIRTYANGRVCHSRHEEVDGPRLRYQDSAPLRPRQVPDTDDTRPGFEILPVTVELENRLELEPLFLDIPTLGDKPRELESLNLRSALLKKYNCKSSFTVNRPDYYMIILILSNRIWTFTIYRKSKELKKLYFLLSKKKYISSKKRKLRTIKLIIDKTFVSRFYDLERKASLLSFPYETGIRGPRQPWEGPHRMSYYDHMIYHWSRSEYASFLRGKPEFVDLL
jgi:hypothetical protein